MTDGSISVNAYGAKLWKRFWGPECWSQVFTDPYRYSVGLTVLYMLTSSIPSNSKPLSMGTPSSKEWFEDSMWHCIRVARTEIGSLCTG